MKKSFVMLALLITLSACGAGAEEQTVPEGFAVPQGIELTAPFAELKLGQTASWIATPTNGSPTVLVGSVNDVISGGDTDIRGALAAFRRECRKEQGDKQAYLITDTEPNNEDGRHLSFENAASGLIEEASRYRQEKIGLNIIMLDQGPELKKLASTIAKKGLGRVFFTVPETIGEVVVEDYLSGRVSN